MEKSDSKSREKFTFRVRYKGKTEFLYFTHGKEYDVLSVEQGWYRIIDDSGEDYLYPPDLFKVIENGYSNSKAK